MIDVVKTLARLFIAPLVALVEGMSATFVTVAGAPWWMQALGIGCVLSSLYLTHLILEEQKTGGGLPMFRLPLFADSKGQNNDEGVNEDDE